jgi:hypothetical protein
MKVALAREAAKEKEYWQLHDVSKWPLVIAIADFHAKGSMLWTSTGLQEYLYGTRHEFSFDSDGKLIISPLKIETHKLGNKKIPSGFFFQPKAEHISVVLFSNSGTISKFTRSRTPISPSVQVVSIASETALLCSFGLLVRISLLCACFQHQRVEQVQLVRSHEVAVVERVLQV